MEEWRKIEGFPRYSVSNKGNIRDDHTGKLRKTTISNIGYPVVKLNGSVRLVHRLECTAFIPNPDNKPTVNHKDGNRSNNDLSNLEWATYKENKINGWRLLDSTRHKMSEAKKKRIMCVETGKTYSCALEASDDSTVGKACITHACNGRYKTAGGYHWKYI